MLKNVSETITKNLEAIRLSHKLSKKEFLETISLSSAAYFSMLNNKTKASLDTLISVSKHFEISIDRLINEDLSSKSDIEKDDKIDIEAIKDSITNIDERLRSIEQLLRNE